MENKANPNTKLVFETWPIDRLIEYSSNPRKNDEAVQEMVAAIKEFGFRIPIVALSDGLIVDGHLRYKAARYLGLKDVPVVLADELTKAQIKAFRLMANKSASWAQWDIELLKIEFEDLKELGYDLKLTGFELSEIDTLMETVDVDAPAPKDESRNLLLVECEGERELEKLFNEIKERGFKCKVMS